MPRARPGSYFARHGMRLPAFKVESAYHQRQLRSQIDRLLQRQSIAQLMQHGSQDGIGRGFVGKFAGIAQFLEPHLHGLDGVSDGVGQCHGFSPFVGEDR